MPRIDMMKTLENFNEALQSKSIKANPVRRNEHILRHEDFPEGGTPRMTYARMKGAHVTAIAVFAIAEPYEGDMCVQIGYAVREDQQGKGIAKELTKIALEDFINFIAETRTPQFVIESTVDRDNLASKAISSALLGIEPEETEDESGMPIWHFIKYIAI